MVDEGHFVGNHTYHHLDMSSISSKESFEKEMKDIKQKLSDLLSAGSRSEGFSEQGGG